MFPYKATMSAANVKTNGIGVQNEPITKNGFLPATTFSVTTIFLKILFQFKNLLLGVDIISQLPKCPYSYFS